MRQIQEPNIKEASADDSLDQAASDDPEEGMVVDIPSAERELLENLRLRRKSWLRTI